MSDSAPRVSVGVIGLGLMGSAMARALVARDLKVTVWNRNAERARALGDGVAVARSAADAIHASDVVIVSLRNPEAVMSALRSDAVERELNGRLFVQLTTTSPSAAREEAAWATRCGASYLGGAILTSPELLGSGPGLLFVSGAREDFERALPILRAFVAEPRRLGESPGVAAVLDHALLELSYGAAAFLYHAIALCEAGGVGKDAFCEVVTLLSPAVLERFAGPIGNGAYPSGSASLHTFDSWARELEATSRELDVDDGLPSALRAAIARAIGSGHGMDDYPALYEAFRSH